jgi:hypothetical protein
MSLKPRLQHQQSVIAAQLIARARTGGCTLPILTANQTVTKAPEKNSKLSENIVQSQQENSWKEQEKSKECLCK